MIDSGVTAGERLCNFVNHKLLAGDAWGDLENLLGATGRAPQLVDFYRQMAAVTLTGRIVAAGRSAYEKHPVGDPLFRTLYLEHLRDTIGIPSAHLNELYRASVRAVQASLAPIPASVAKQMKAWAILRHQTCYMCGTTLDFDVAAKINSYTCEHIWPRHYGGDSIEENFLPACQSCNSKKKRDFATWVMPSVQTLLHGMNPEAQRLIEIDGTYKFSLHYRAAQSLAIQKRRSMKQAFLEIGPWTDVRVVDIDDVADFFNLENHLIQ
jgi:hypothetical protein